MIQKDSYAAYTRYTKAIHRTVSLGCTRTLPIKPHYCLTGLILTLTSCGHTNHCLCRSHSFAGSSSST